MNNLIVHMQPNIRSRQKLKEQKQWTSADTSTTQVIILYTQYLELSIYKLVRQINYVSYITWPLLRLDNFIQQQGDHLQCESLIGIDSAASINYFHPVHLLSLHLRSDSRIAVPRSEHSSDFMII